MPVHVHGDEEELFFVLRGSGLSWQDGRTYAVGRRRLPRAPRRRARPTRSSPATTGSTCWRSARAPDRADLAPARRTSCGRRRAGCPSTGRTRSRPRRPPGRCEVPAPGGRAPARRSSRSATCRAPSADRGAVRVQRRDVGAAGGARAHAGSSTCVVAPGAAASRCHCHTRRGGAVRRARRRRATLRLGDERLPGARRARWSRGRRARASRTRSAPATRASSCSPAGHRDPDGHRASTRARRRSYLRGLDVIVPRGAAGLLGRRGVTFERAARPARWSS